MASLINQTQLVKNRQMPLICNQGCPWRWQPSQDVMVDAGFVHNKAGVLRDTIYIQNVMSVLYDWITTKWTHFKTLLHLVCNTVVPAQPSPHQTSVAVVSLSSLFRSIVSKEMQYSFINLLVVSHYVSCTPFPCPYNVTESTHKGFIWDLCWNTQPRSWVSYIKSWKIKELYGLITWIGHVQWHAQY